MWLKWCLVCCLGGAFAFEDYQIANGVRLLETPGTVSEERSTDGSLVSNFRQFLATHELQVKLDEILPAQEDVQSSLKRALDYLNGLDTPHTGTSAGTFFLGFSRRYFPS